jgi:hypothetical protein
MRRDSRGLWVLSAGNMQAIKIGFYLLHDKFFEIISNIFGSPTHHGLIEDKREVKLLTPNEIWCLFLTT